jgi:hypothetical protein
MVQPLWKRLAAHLTVKHRVTTSPSDSAPRYLLKTNANVHPHKTRTRTLTEALFTINKTREQLKCPSTSEQNDKMQYGYTME